MSPAINIKTKVMKALVVALFSVVFALNTSAGNNPRLVKEIHKKAFISLDKINLEKNKKEFVVVKFVIRNGAIYILDIKGSQEVLERRVQERLESINVKANYEADKKYTMRFSFEAE